MKDLLGNYDKYQLEHEVEIKTVDVQENKGDGTYEQQALYRVWLRLNAL